MDGEGLIKMKKNERTLFFVLALGLVMLVSIPVFAGNIRHGSNVFTQLKDWTVARQAARKGWQICYEDTTVSAAGVEDIGMMVEGCSAEQAFSITEEMLQYDMLAVGIQIGTYQRKNPCSLFVEIKQADYTKLYKVDASTIKDGKQLEILFPTEGLAPASVTLSIYSDAERTDQAVTVFIGDSLAYSENCTINGVIREKNLLMTLYTPDEGQAGQN